MASMTDRNTSSPGSNLVNKVMQMIYCLTATTTYTPGTGGGSAFTVTPPFLLALMTAMPGGDTGNNTEATTGNCPGYTTLASGGKSMGSPAFGNPSGGQITSSNSQSWTATGSWAAIIGIEIWDSAATKLRYLQGTITSVTLANGNTLTFAAAAITADASAW